MTHAFYEICQNHLPIAPWVDGHLARLPGLNPLPKTDWILVDSAFEKQMAYTDQLMADRSGEVLALDASAQDASREMLENILAAISDIDGYEIEKDHVVRPDGVAVTLDQENALKVARRLVQQDLCLMLPVGEEHILAGGAMCFPASWTLSEKFMRPMTGIHEPVVEYGSELAHRVERMFRMMRPAQDMWRANWLVYANPDLHQPRRGGEKRPESEQEQWMRVERQSLRKLPNSGAIVFGIHTIVVPFDRLSNSQIGSLREINVRE